MRFMERTTLREMFSVPWLKTSSKPLRIWLNEDEDMCVQFEDFCVMLD